MIVLYIESMKLSTLIMQNISFILSILICTVGVIGIRQQLPYSDYQELKYNPFWMDKEYYAQELYDWLGYSRVIIAVVDTYHWNADVAGPQEIERVKQDLMRAFVIIANNIMPIKDTQCTIGESTYDLTYSADGSAIHGISEESDWPVLTCKKFYNRMVCELQHRDAIEAIWRKMFDIAIEDSLTKIMGHVDGDFKEYLQRLDDARAEAEAAEKERQNTNPEVCEGEECY